MKWVQTETYYEMSRKAASLIAAQIVNKPTAVLGLATGSTPLGIYRQLIEWYKKGDLDFSQVTTVNLDEYYGLDGNNDQSYRYFMENNLFQHVNVRPECTFVPSGIAEDVEAECKAYDARIQELGGIDIQLLGIGLDGHIGFNEPADFFEKETHLVTLDPSTIEANSRFFASPEDVPTQAITMGMGSIFAAKKILLVANGKAKEEILKKAIYGPITPEVPASILQLHPDLTVVYTPEKA